MEKDLTTMLNEWEENDDYEKIIQTIKKILNNDVTFELKKFLGRAYNKTSQYNKALKILLPDEVIGREDAMWNYSVGYAYYYKKEYETAILYFKRSHLLGDEAAKSYEKWCLNEILNKKWYKITLNALEVISKNNGDWSLLSTLEQKVVAIYLFQIDMTNGGFVTFFCNWGYVCYLNALAGLKEIGCSKQVNIIKKQFKIIQHLDTDFYEFNLQEIPRLLTSVENSKIEVLDNQYLQNNQNLSEKVFETYADFFKNYNQNKDKKKKKINVKILNLDLNTKH